MFITVTSLRTEQVPIAFHSRYSEWPSCYGRLKKKRKKETKNYQPKTETAPSTVRKWEIIIDSGISSAFVYLPFYYVTTEMLVSFNWLPWISTHFHYNNLEKLIISIIYIRMTIVYCYLILDSLDHLSTFDLSLFLGPACELKMIFKISELRKWNFSFDLPKQQIINMLMHGTSLVVQWLRLHAPNAGSLSSIPFKGAKIPHAATKSSHATTKDLTCHN